MATDEDRSLAVEINWGEQMAVRPRGSIAVTAMRVGMGTQTKARRWVLFTPWRTREVALLVLLARADRCGVHAVQVHEDVGGRLGGLRHRDRHPG